MLKSRLIYLGIVLVSFIFSQALYESVSFMTFVIVLVLPVISILISLIMLPFISVKIGIVSSTVCRLSNFTIRFVIKGICPFISPIVKVTCYVPDESGLDLQKTVFTVNTAYSTKSFFDYQCSFTNRGSYEIRVTSIEIYDFLKLIKIKRPIKQKSIIQVLPRRILIDIPVISQENIQENTYVIGENLVVSGGDMVGVRDYIMGDNLKNVHWKLSSKSEDLVTKTFAEDICDRAFIVMDMSCYYDDVYQNKGMTDCIVEVALCAINEYSKKAIRFSVLLNESKNIVSRYVVASPSEALSVSAAVSKVKMQTETDILDMLKNLDFNMLSGAEVIVITSFKSSDILKDVKKMFVDKKVKLNVINITENESEEKSDMISFTREYLENSVRGMK